MLLTFLNTLATIISVISLLIVTYGVLVGFVAFLRNEIKRFNGTYIFLEESSSANSLISLFKNTERTVLTTTTPPKIASSSKVGSTTVFSMSEAIKNSNPSKR